MRAADTSAEKSAGGFARYVPVVSWLPRYDRSWLTVDVVAGLTLWGLVVPEAMAYAGIAGLPPQAGLYTLVVALLLYALFGSARHLAVGPTSATAALLASSVAAALVSFGANASADSETFRAYASAFILVTGVVFLAAGLARLGFITQFLSKPVMDGFVAGLAVFVAVGQLNKLFGVEKPEGNTVEKLFGIIKELPQANWASFAIGAISLALLFLLPRLSKRIPGGLLVLFVSIIVSSGLNLHANQGVAIVGSLPQGLPSFALPHGVPFAAYLGMVLPAMGVLLVAFSEALGVAEEFADKHGYEINPDQELNAHAVVNLASAFFGGMIAGGGMSASAVKEGAGGRTQVSNLVTWAATIITLLFLTPLFTSLPEAVLGALIIHAVWHIIAARKLATVRLESRAEFAFGVLAFAGVILIDVLQGMVIGLVASLLFVIYRTSRPHVASLGRVPGVPGAYSDLTRHPENTPVPGVLIVRPDAQLYYANALTFRDAVTAMIEDMPTPPRAVIFDAAGQDQIDVTSVEMLKGMLKRLRDSGIDVYFADVHAPVRDHAEKTGLVESVGEDHLFATVDAAVKHVESATAGAALPGNPGGATR